MNVNSAFINKPAASRGRILVVDSDSQVCDMIKSHLEPDGFAVACCSTSEDLYNYDIDEYRLVIVDLSVDDGAGINLIQQVKQIAAEDAIAVIACSQRMSPATIIAALNAGADDYLLKPFSLRELHARVTALLRRS